MGESLDFMRKQAQRYPTNIVGGTKESGMGYVLEENLSTEREIDRGANEPSSSRAPRDRLEKTLEMSRALSNPSRA
ncbi:hypothetical protein Hanom_Chr07g00664941 [Helianthus anomalus]